MLILKKYCGDVHNLNIPPPPYVTISHHFRVAPAPSPGDAPFERPHTIFHPGNCNKITDFWPA